MTNLFREARPAPRALPRRGSAEMPWSVEDLSHRIGQVLGDGFPGRLWVEGELSRVSRTSGGGVWLSLREGQAVLEAVAWREAASHLPEGLRRGDQVRAFGSLRTWKGQSRYQLVVERLERAGLGLLLQELREREIRLAREGLFASDRKRPLPRVPLRVGLLTSHGSDAWRDFIDTARRRFPGIGILCAHSPVQGTRAPQQLMAGLRQLARAVPDFIVITRGGGSFEDLLPFSDEALVRAVACCPVPVVSAIGHDADRPLLDQAADVRSKTPTAAAEENIPDRRDLLAELDNGRQSAERCAEAGLDRARRTLAARAAHRGFSALPNRVREQETRVGAGRQRADDTLRRRLDQYAGRLRERREMLATLHPGGQLESRKRALNALKERITTVDAVGMRWRRLPGFAARLSPDRFHRLVDAARRAAALAGERADTVAAQLLDRFGARAARHRERLRGQDPLLALRRGYSLALDSRGRVLCSAARVAVGEDIRILLAEGGLDARVLAAFRRAPAAGDTKP